MENGTVSGKPPSGAPRVRGPAWLLAVSATAFGAAVLLLNWLQLRALSISKGIDQTYLLESLTNTVHGRFFVTTHAITSLGGWGAMDHFWPGMLLFLPLVAVLEHPMVLYLINALCLTLTGLWVYAIARHFLTDRCLALGAALAFWTMPEIYYSAITGSWPEVWAVPWLALMFLAFFRRRPVVFSLAALVFMSCMEQMLLFVALFAVVELLGRRQRLWIVLPAALAALWLGLLAAAAPTLGGARFFVHPLGFGWGRVAGFFAGLLLDLDRSPLVYLALLWPSVFVIALPVIAVVIGWGFDLALVPANDGVLRYAFFLYLVIAVGGIKGIAILTRALGPRLRQPPRRCAGTVLALILAAHVAALVRMAPAELPRYRADAADTLVWEVIRGLPANARVASNRQISYAFVGRAELFVGLWELPPPLQVKELYFDLRNVPRGRWLAEDKYLAMGRHTPAAFVLDLDDGGRPVVARGLWADPNFAVDTVRCVDIDGDGRLDVILAAADGGITAYLGTGNLELTLDRARQQLAARTEPQSRSVRHLRAPGERVRVGGSGWLQLAPDRTALELGSQDGSEECATSLPLGGYLAEVVVDDLDRDGFDDAVALDSQGYRLWILRGGADGGLTASGPFDAPPIPTSVTSADLDDDGRAELVVTKSQLLPDLDAFERFLDHERVDHLLWYGEALTADLDRHFSGRASWVAERRPGLLLLTRPSLGEAGLGGTDRAAGGSLRPP